MPMSDMDWLEGNYESLLRCYRDKWVLINACSVVAAADCLDHVCDRARELGISEPFVVKIVAHGKGIS